MRTLIYLDDGTMIETHQDSEARTTGDSVELVHIVCCRDYDIVRCGLRMPGSEFERYSTDVDCVPCELAYVRDVCPKYSLCPESDSAQN